MTTDITQIVERLESEEEMVLVPRALLASASSAIDKKRDGPVTLELLRHYSLKKSQPVPVAVAWQCLRKGPGRFVVTLERAVAEEWARKGWPMRALCERNPEAAFLEYTPEGAKDPE